MKNIKTFILCLASFGLLFTSLLAPAFSKSAKKASQSVSAKQINEEDKQLIQCIKDKGLTMYGTSWCPHCKHQKVEFGAKNDEEFAQLANYVDCDANPQECRSRKVTGYPTWLLPDGKEIQPGSIKELAQDCGCNISQITQQSQIKPAKNDLSSPQSPSEENSTQQEETQTQPQLQSEGTQSN